MGLRAPVAAVFLAGVVGCAGSGLELEAGAKKTPAEILNQIDAQAAPLIEPIEDPPAPLVVIRGGTILTASGARYEPGYLILDAGRIKALGSGDPGAVKGASVVDATGLYVTPGLIDAHSHIGVYPSPYGRGHGDGNEMSSPVTGGAWAEHAVYAQDPAIERAVAGGVTTIQVLTGSANLIGGRGVTLHLAPRRGSRAMRYEGAPHGVKMACGENPKRTYGEKGRSPQTRMGNLREMRRAFAQAQQHLDKLAKRKKKKGQADQDATTKRLAHPLRDVDMETLAGVLEGHLLPQVHCYRADDMLVMLQLAAEFGFRVRAFHHALDAYKIRDVLAKHEVAVATWTDWWGFKLEALDAVPQSPALLTEAGVRAVIKSDSSREIQRLNQEAAKAYYAGRAAGIELTEDDALKWVTANPAWVLGIDKDVGTLEVGKRADVVVWDRHPFSVYARARWVFIDGLLRHDSARQGPPWSDFMHGQEVAP